MADAEKPKRFVPEGYKWPKGVSGNPAGRPKKGQCLSDILEKQGRKRIEWKGPDGVTRKIAQRMILAQKIWALALSGDITAIKYIYDRIDGSPRQSVEHSGDMTYTVIPAQPSQSEEAIKSEGTDADG